MKETKNELLQFVGGIVMLAVGLFIFSQKVIVHSSWFGYGGFSVAGIRISSGLVIVPLIIGIIWMFTTGANFEKKGVHSIFGTSYNSISHNVNTYSS